LADRLPAPTPAGARLSVTEPPISDDDGLWLPPSAQGLGGEVEVGVVLELGADCKLPLEAADRVYFNAHHFTKLGDVKIVPEEYVIAYEKR
jgi:hypothetical protein